MCVLLGVRRDRYDKFGFAAGLMRVFFEEFKSSELDDNDVNLGCKDVNLDFFCSVHIQ